MDGILLFGHESIDVSPWSDKQAIVADLDSLSSFIESVNNSGYAQVKVPEDWANQVIDSLDFWGRLTQIFVDHNLLGFVASQLYDNAFNKCMDKSRQYLQSRDDVLNNNPNYNDMEYCGVLRLNNEWADIPTALQISNSEELFDFALSYLERFPYNEVNYIERCKKVFTNLMFHNDIAASLETHGTVSKKSSYSKAPVTGIKGFSFAVTKAFHALNGLETKNRTSKEMLSELAAKLGYDCTPQGSDKKHLQYKLDVSGETRTVNCEFHIKISDNNRNDATYFQDRIYFGFVTMDDQTKIFVVHSGKHL